MTSILIVDSDPIALELLQRAFHVRHSVTCIALDAREAVERISIECRDCDGLITNIDLGGAKNGWDLARLARAENPDIAIGYMSAEGHRDWVAYGVPHSVLLNTAIEADEIAAGFLLFCDSLRSVVTPTGRTSRTPPPQAPDAAPSPGGQAFFAVDWAATPLGGPETWDGTLRSWVRFLLAMDVPLLMLWGEDRITLFNEPFRAAFGDLFGDVLGRAFPLPAAENWRRCADLLDQSLCGQTGGLPDIRLARRMGPSIEERCFDLSCAPVQDTAGWTVGALCLFTDTTEAMRSAEIVRGEHHDLYAPFMQAPGFVAFLEGPEHRFTFANSAYLRLTERTHVVGLRVKDAFPEIVAQGFIEILDRIYSSGELFVAKGITAAFRRPDGSEKEVFIDLNYFAIRGPGGQIRGIFVSGEDATEYHRAQARIGVLQNELIHVSRVNAMGMMVSTIAHELNQPLTAIHNYMAAAKMILERSRDASPAREALQGAADSALRAGDIIRNLKAMTTRREVLHRPVPIEETLREAAALASLGQFNAQIVFDLHCRHAVQGDKILIQQVVFNLVRNALEAATAKVCITISTAEAGAFVEVCVGDDGPGICPALLPKVFDSFVTTKSEGTGIGLSICKAIIEAHGGAISVRNGEKDGAAQGATFCFTLPQVS